MTRAGALVAAPPGDLAEELSRLRREAAQRYTEVDLLVAAMREHIEDLRQERNRLVAELEEARDALRRKESPWLERGQKPPR